MNAMNGTTFNSTVRFRCDTDFLLVGSETIVCKSDGKWSGDTPRCVAKCNIVLIKYIAFLTVSLQQKVCESIIMICFTQIA
jgi:hypothetical protein